SRATFVTKLARSARLSCALALDAHGMEPSANRARPNPMPRDEDDARFEGIRQQLEGVLGGERNLPGSALPPPAVDVRTYLLDPPPTDDELALRERRRLLVRRGSLGCAALLSLVLLAP